MEPKQAVQLLRRMRHDYTNHIQVLSGWLELDSPERAREALDEMTSLLEQQHMILNHPQPEAALYMFRVATAAAEEGVELICEDLEFSSLDLLIQADQPLTALRELKKEAQLNTVKIYLSIAEDNNAVDLMFAVENGRYAENNTHRIVSLSKE